jgi:Spy/CpxP family protein refolding chaperone
MKRLLSYGLSLFAICLLTTSLIADETKREAKPRDGERKPAEAGAPRGERKPNADAAPRGERPAGARDGGRSEFPAEIKLTEDQQTKLTELRTKFSATFGELAQKRDAIYTAEQLKARKEVEEKMRAGNLGRQEYADLVESTVKLTPDQKTKIAEVEQEANKLRAEIEKERNALLTDEQRTTLRKLNTARSMERMFSLPGELKPTEEQIAGLKKLQSELGDELASLTEKRDSIMTPERRMALEEAMKKLRESNNTDRQAFADAMQSALNLSAAEKAELSETEGKLRDVQKKVHEGMLSLLTAEQKAEFEKRLGGRSRN